MTMTLEQYARQIGMHPIGLAHQIRLYLESKETHTIYGAIPNAPIVHAETVAVNNARMVLLAAKNKGNYDDILQQTETILTPKRKPIWSKTNGNT